MTYNYLGESMIIGVDTGGTFTDFVYKEGHRWGVYKVLSTPSNPAQAVLEGLSSLSEGKKKQIIHGSTVATNAILERDGARTALITSKGFEDIIFWRLGQGFLDFVEFP